LSTIFPPALLFGLGLSITVAPLTAAVLAGVDEEHAGIASGVNNAVARVASLLAIGVVGAVVAAQFSSTLDDRLSQERLSADARAGVEHTRSRPLTTDLGRGVPRAERPRATTVVEDASVDAFRAGIAASAFLVLL